jgi:predicted DCC family thiol-disulfide oxidoreductase YuxK
LPYKANARFQNAKVSLVASMPHPILFYDGVCGLCNRFVQFVLRRDRNDLFRFAALQSSIAARILSRHSINPGALDTVYVVVNHDLPDERILSRSDAVLFVLNQLKSPWRQAAFSLALVPRFARDWAYNAIAQHRYGIFGRSEICMLPSDQDHSRFLDG